MSKALRDTLWWILAGTRGGVRRANIILALRDRPMSASHLQRLSGLDYTTVRYHLDLLMDNDLVVATTQKYGKMYFISPLLEADYHLFEDIWENIVNTKG